MSIELKTPDGKVLDVEEGDRAFSEMMAAPATDTPAPQKMTEAQKDEIKSAPKRTRARPGKTERARTTTAATSQKVDKDFSEDIAGLTTGLWITAASIPYTSPYAVVVKQAQPQLVHNLNAAAQNNAQVRGYVEKLGSGGGGVWAIGLSITAAQMGMSILQIARDPELRKQLGEQSRAELQQYLEQQGLVQVAKDEPDNQD
jgi:hypothetical protein